MNEETTLLPCPFCGGEAEIRERKVHIKHGWFGKDYRLMYQAKCTKCGATVGKYQPCLIHRNERTGEEHGAIATWNTRATHGTLTAEQVMTIAGRHQPDYCSDTHVCFDWQAIADELNATLGGGECEQVLTDCDDGLMPPFTAHCSRCGVEWGFTPKYCHNCGARVTGTRDERKAVKR